MYIIKHKLYESLLRGVSPEEAENYRWRNPEDGTIVNIKDVVLALKIVLQDIGETYPSVWDCLKHKDVLFTGDVPTMATDGISIFINPSFCEDLLTGYKKSKDKGLLYIEFVLIHEVFHTLFDHVRQYNNERDKFPDFNKVNRAQDYEINYIISNCVRDGLQCPFKGIVDEIGGCYDDDFGRQGLTWEEIYHKIPTKRRNVKKQQTPDEWKKGFLDGYNKAIQELKNQKLIERCVLK